ncbi:MAG: hypothetical protein ACFFA6_16350, partial [Promethearchaeota archaeon]
MSKDIPLNIPGIPYGFKETFKWIAKHTIYDIIYPITLFSFLILIINIVNVYLMLASICILSITIGLVFYFWIRTKLNKIESIGKKYEKKWWYHSFNQLSEDNIICDLGFVGDIMKMNDYTLEFDTEVKRFFNGVKLIVGNLEGIITNAKGPNILRHKHKEIILSDLLKICDPSPKWLICVSNNHSADFEKTEFSNSNKLINGKEEFSTFGDNNNQNYMFNNEINIVSGTMWTNFKNDYVAQFRNITEYYQPEKFNILFPHWHYENECYVRKDIYLKSLSLIRTGIYYKIYKIIPRRIRPKVREIYDQLQQIPPIEKISEIFQVLPNNQNVDLQKIEQSRRFQKLIKERNQQMGLNRWSLIFGHHTHVPQPIIKYGNSLLVFSGGNFTSSKARKNHRSGLILRCQIGRLNDSLVLGRIDWSYTINERDKKKKEVTVYIDKHQNKLKKYDFRPSKFTKNLIIVTVIYCLIA